MMAEAGAERKPGRPLVAFYGDDFTGAAENMVQYHRHGLRTFMFLDRPTPAAFAEKAGAFEVVGIAGIARSLAPDAMVEEVEPVLRLFAEAGIDFVQYKLCSTLDSSESVGNLGTVVALARRIYPGCFVPVFAATPEFGRYTAFGHHFARFGDGVFRLDRHPSMSRHPVTPMREADVREILRAQGAPAPGLVDLRTLEGGLGRVLEAVERERGTDGLAPVVFDGIVDDHCPLVAEAVWSVGRSRPVVALSAQGFAHGFGRFWRKRPADREPPVEALSPAEGLLVLSGSSAPQTARQIQAFGQAGAALIRLGASQAVDPSHRPPALDQAARVASDALGDGRAACIFTALGPDDDDTGALDLAARRLGLDHGALSERIGSALAEIALALVGRHRLRRVVLAGGDTSSYALRAMRPDGLAVVSGDYRASAHVFRLSGPGPVDGLEVAIKGGQVGDDAYFTTLRDGRSASTLTPAPASPRARS